MRVNRRFLYWGIFLVAVGGVLVTTDAGALDAGSIAGALRLWPVAIVAIGVGIVLRRTRFGLAAGMLAAAAPGLLIGGGLAALPQIAVDCGSDEGVAAVGAREGVFDGPAMIAVSAGCGSLVVDTAPGDAWHLESGSTSDRAPAISASSRSLAIDAHTGAGLFGHSLDRDDWRLTLPTSVIDELSFVVNAGHGEIDLAGARIDHLDITTNAAQAGIDLSGADVARLSGSVNAGMVTIDMPGASDLVGSVEVNAGALHVCAPSGLGLSVRHDGAVGGISVNGRHETDSVWESPNYASALYRADLEVDVNFGNVEINPIGGCK